MTNVHKPVWRKASKSSILSDHSFVILRAAELRWCVWLWVIDSRHARHAVGVGGSGDAPCVECSGEKGAALSALSHRPPVTFLSRHPEAPRPRAPQRETDAAVWLGTHGANCWFTAAVPQSNMYISRRGQSGYVYMLSNDPMSSTVQYCFISFSLFHISITISITL